MTTPPINRTLVLVDAGAIEYADGLTDFDNTGGGTPTPSPSLQALSLSPNTATVGTAYTATISGRTSGSALALSGAGVAGLSISGNTLSGTPTTSGAINITETLAGATGSPRANNGVGTVAAAGGAALQALSLSPNTATAGTVYTGTITGKTSGSTITLSGAGADGLTVSGTTISGTPTTSGAVNTIETLGSATNSPRTTPGVITVAAASVSLQALTVMPNTATAGTAYTGTINGKTSGSALDLTGAGAAGMSISGTTLSGTPTSDGPINIVETLNTATNSPRTNSGVVTVAAGTISISRAAPLAADDFETNSQPLTGRSGWSGDTGYWATRNGRLNFERQYADAGRVKFGTVPVNNVRVKITATKATDGLDGQWEHNRGSTFFHYVDDNNYVRGDIDSLNRVNLTAMVAGSQVFNGYMSMPPAAGVIDPLNTDVTMTLFNGELYFTVNDQPVLELPNRYSPPFNHTPLTPTSAGQLSFTGGTLRQPISNAVRIDAAKALITRHDRFAGRSAVGATSGNLRVEVTFTGTPDRWLYRVTNTIAKTEVKGWSVATGAVSGGVWKGTVSVPVGGPYTIEVGYEQGGAFYTAGTTAPSYCGMIVGFYGQSNTSGRRDRALDTTIVVAGDKAVTRWSINDDTLVAAKYERSGEGSTAMATATMVSTAMGNIPVLAIVGGRPAVGLDYLTDDANFDTYWTQPVRNFATGVIDAVVWDQGENEAQPNVGVSDYATRLVNNLLPKLRTSAQNPNLPFFISTLGRLEDNLGDGSERARVNAGYDGIRKQHLLATTLDSKVYVSDSKLGTHVVDGHYDGLGYTEACYRAGLTIGKVLSGTGYDGRGPLPTSATRSGAAITITLDLNGATGITDYEANNDTENGDNTNQQLANTVRDFQVSADNFATLLPISSVAKSGNSIVITLASAPGAAVKVRSHYGASYDGRGTFNGTYASTKKIAVFPIITPLTTN